MTQHLLESDQSYNKNYLELSAREVMGQNYTRRLNGSLPESGNAVALQYRPFLQQTQSPSADTYQHLQDRLNFSAALVGTVGVFVRAAEATGNFVRIDPNYGCLPLLIGSDQNVVLLYEFIEEWDSLTDYDDLRERLPNLTFVQISGAVNFLRKLVQFNTKSLDVDALEDNVLEGNAEFRATIKNAIGDKETSRVLDSD